MESEVDSKWLQQEESNLVSVECWLGLCGKFQYNYILYFPQKKRLSLITTGSESGDNSNNNNTNNSPLSANSHHSQSPKFSPQNSISGPHSLNNDYNLSSPKLPSTPTPLLKLDSQMHLQNNTSSNCSSGGGNDSNHGSLQHSKSISLEHCIAPTTPQSTTTTTKSQQQQQQQQQNRSNDIVYVATTNVVKAIMALSQGVEKAIAREYLDLVRNVGIELRSLLAAVDQLSNVFPAQAHK